MSAAEEQYEKTIGKLENWKFFHNSLFWFGFIKEETQGKAYFLSQISERFSSEISLQSIATPKNFSHLLLETIFLLLFVALFTSDSELSCNYVQSKNTLASFVHHFCLIPSIALRSTWTYFDFLFFSFWNDFRLTLEHSCPFF